MTGVIWWLSSNRSSAAVYLLHGRCTCLRTVYGLVVQDCHNCLRTSCARPCLTSSFHDCSYCWHSYDTAILMTTETAILVIVDIAALIVGFDCPFHVSLIIAFFIIHHSSLIIPHHSSQLSPISPFPCFLSSQLNTIPSINQSTDRPTNQSINQSIRKATTFIKSPKRSLPSSNIRSLNLLSLIRSPISQHM